MRQATEWPGTAGVHLSCPVPPCAAAQRHTPTLLPPAPPPARVAPGHALGGGRLHVPHPGPLRPRHLPRSEPPHRRAQPAAPGRLPGPVRRAALHGGGGGGRQAAAGRAGAARHAALPVRLPLLQPGLRRLLPHALRPAAHAAPAGGRRGILAGRLACTPRWRTPLAAARCTHMHAPVAGAASHRTRMPTHPRRTAASTRPTASSGPSPTPGRAC